ncbi:TPA: hypothetical protein VB501_000524 [Streptococcus pyogenes]|nr:hypothetical protein [Streptococcus pyogenes]
MKTRSKRFLKLATLCLALLSATLLMTQPVKAETSELSGFYKARERGETDGYQSGLNGDDFDLSKIKVPNDIEDQFGGDYKDAYEGGYERGRRAADPVGTFLQDVWSFLTYTFKSIFGFDQDSQ